MAPMRVTTGKRSLVLNLPAPAMSLRVNLVNLVAAFGFDTPRGIPPVERCGNVTHPTKVRPRPQLLLEAKTRLCRVALVFLLLRRLRRHQRFRVLFLRLVDGLSCRVQLLDFRDVT